MAKPISSIQFVTKLQEAVIEYKRQLSDTRDESDAAHFFDAGLKKFLKDHPDEMIILAGMNCERAFMSFVKHYLLKG